MIKQMFCCFFLTDDKTLRIIWRTTYAQMIIAPFLTKVNVQSLVQSKLPTLLTTIGSSQFGLDN